MKSPPLQEVCDGKDNNCNGQIDETFNEKDRPCKDDSQKGECQNGLYTACKHGKLVCSSNTRPKDEDCNNQLDDDCDGQIDENPPCACKTGEIRTCGRDVGECKQGTQTCDSNQTWGPCIGEVGPAKEICDGKDNDCNGTIDDGFANLGQPCSVGIGECKQTGTIVCSKDTTKVECSVQAGIPTQEVCDGKDNDCDGKVDENWPNLGQSCTSGKGVCSQQGTLVCATDFSGATCDATPGTPLTETCNGKDDDCDGQIDNQPQTKKPLTQPCYTGPRNTAGIGLCKRGVYTCKNGSWDKSTCVGQVLPQPQDLCRGQDDNCNGTPNDGCSCTVDTIQPCGTNVGSCKTGTQTCKKDGTWGACKNAIKPVPEECNGQDDDCDGKTDENWPDLGKPCTVGIGACQNTGTYVCKDPQNLRCSATPLPKQKEVCNGKDDDCNGQIDDALSLSTTCNTGKPGECLTGTQSCHQGKLLCTPIKAPALDICRNNKDEDCDGKIDGICGPLYNYAIVKFDAKLTKNRGLDQAKKLGSHVYELYGKNITQGCTNTPLFLTPQSLYMRLMSYSCGIRADNTDPNRYYITISQEIKTYLHNSPKTADANFYAVQPAVGETWAEITPGCNNGNNNTCTLRLKSGSITEIRRVYTGIYRVSSPLCQNIRYRPIFVTITGTHPYAYAITYTYGNYCWVKVRTYNGTLTNNYGFAIWLPNHTTIPYATMQLSYNQISILASNDFGNPFATWSSQAKYYATNTCPSTNQSCYRSKINFGAWANPSAVLVTVRTDARGTASFFPEANGDLIVSTLLYYYNGNRKIWLTGIPWGTRFNVLFVQ